ncbi:MAG TPA: tyrosinase family protein [Thermoanaerobaculia bacterium]|nr:tyrosinase family protein [Thermoanaerobaculia bacterium]
MAHSRRTFIKTTAAAVAGATLFDVDELMAAPPFVRLDVGGLTATSPALVSYAKAIHAMQALPTTDPLSWAYQAAIHYTTLPGSHPAWNTCQHGTPFFWSWHRMYLYWFERIIRKMAPDANFALPFWNYELASERYLPVPFRNPSSPLYTVNRGPGWNAGTSFLSPSAVATSGFMPTVPYFNAQSGCEGTPHGAVHVSIGGWMGSVPTAAQDPIFYLHHANIDRLWNAWLKQGGGRTNPLNDGPWKTTKFLFFDENRNEKWMTGCDVLRAALQLQYTYQGEGSQVNEYCLRVLPWWIYKIEYLQEVAIPIPKPGPDPGPVEINLTQVRERLLTLAKESNTDVTLELDDVIADRQPNVFWEVYLGLPKGTAPNPESPFYLGNVALFGHGIRGEHEHNSGPAHFEFKLDTAMNRAFAVDKSGTLTLQFVARGAESKGRAEAVRSDATLSIGKARIGVRRLTKS